MLILHGIVHCAAPGVIQTPHFSQICISFCSACGAVTEWCLTTNHKATNLDPTTLHGKCDARACLSPVGPSCVSTECMIAKVLLLLSDPWVAGREIEGLYGGEGEHWILSQRKGIWDKRPISGAQKTIEMQNFRLRAWLDPLWGEASPLEQKLCFFQRNPDKSWFNSLATTLATDVAVGEGGGQLRKSNTLT